MQIKIPINKNFLITFIENVNMTKETWLEKIENKFAKQTLQPLKSQTQQPQSLQLTQSPQQL
ncbi:MAG: hypothetical protein Ta2D_08340 [Rickettsiales bacterium]|nr:MAG: hypothetical protein Ta2D_08340 [Rickettsiales bacterium]